MSGKEYRDLNRTDTISGIINMVPLLITVYDKITLYSIYLYNKGKRVRNFEAGLEFATAPFWPLDQCLLKTKGTL